MVIEHFLKSIAATALFIVASPTWPPDSNRPYLAQHGNWDVVSGSSTFEDPAVTNFREFLRINSAHGNPNLVKGYDECTEWLKKQANELGLIFHKEVFPLQPNETDKAGIAFAVTMTWIGSNPQLKTIMLNSHMDVVAVVPENWEKPPFEAFKDENGTIIARGAIDNKLATVGVLEAIRRMKSSSPPFQPLRTIHITVVPDEEIGGKDGMMRFVETEVFRKMNVGLEIDESGPDDTILKDTLFVPHTEKTIWQFNFTTRGAPTHASQMPPGEETAAKKLQTVINRLLEYRESEYAKMIDPANNFTIQDITSINLSGLGGFNGRNIVPSELWASFDMRIRIRENWTVSDVEKMLNVIKDEAGPGVEYKTLGDFPVASGVTDISKNVWWDTLEDTCDQLNVTCLPVVLPGVSDARHVRSKTEFKISAFGLSPFLNTNSTAHQDNENINEKEFLLGIPRYEAFIRAISAVPENAVDHV